MKVENEMKEKEVPAPVGPLARVAEEKESSVLQETPKPVTREKKEPLPLESLPPLPPPGNGREREKILHWNRLLTGNLETVPMVLLRKEAPAAGPLSIKGQDYRLAADINRSWVVDHKNMSREQVRAEWPELRRKMAAELGVQDDEKEVYTALSVQHQDSEALKKIEQVFSDAYAATLRGEKYEPAESEAEREIAEAARVEAEIARQEYMPLAEAVSGGWSALKAQETDFFPLPELVSGAPGLLKAVDELADLPAEERAKVYEIARSLPQTQQLEQKEKSLGEAMLHSARRGSADLRHAMVQGAGHLVTAAALATSESIGNETLRKGAEALDKRLQSLAELRRVAQGEVFPIKMGPERSFAAEVAVDVAGAVPGAVLAFMGGAGFGSLALAGTGASVAEARQRNPKGRQELQAAAGIMAGALQTGIYLGMSRIGANMLNKTINEFLKSGKSGVRGYALSALKAGGMLTAENAKLLLAGAASQATELGMQELAARVDNVASNIDWEAFGKNLTEIESNLREAAMNLPFVLIAAGRAALHHFRAPDALLENTALLEDWGVDDAARRRILAERDLKTRNEMLRKRLCSSKRWSGGGSLEELARSLKLLNTEHHVVFDNPQTVRSFLKMPPAYTMLKGPEFVKRNYDDPETIMHMTELMDGRRRIPLNVQRCIPYMEIWDEWNQAAFGEWMHEPEHRLQRMQQYRDLLKDKRKILPSTLRVDGYYVPYRAKLVNLTMSDIVKEIINLSYHYLMNVESLDSLTQSYKSVKHAREATERTRREIISQLCEAVAEVAQGALSEDALAKFDEVLEAKYDFRRSHAKHAARWLRLIKREAFRNGFKKAFAMQQRGKAGIHPQLMEAYRVMLGFHACGEMLLEVIPQTEDFQELLNMGYTPSDAMTHILSREFGPHLLPEIWKHKPLDVAGRNKVDNEFRLKKAASQLKYYTELTGNKLESSPDGSGKELWRIKRPDGQYTPWLPAPGYALNSLSGHTMMYYLPMGGKSFFEDLMKCYHYDPVGRSHFFLRHLYSQNSRKFTGFDHLGQTATRDLRTLWLGDATHYSMGLDYVADARTWSRKTGKLLGEHIKHQAPETGYILRLNEVETPLNLSRIRFQVYWHRLLSSGWVKPEEAAETLLHAGLIDPDSMQNLLQRGEPKLVNKLRLSGPARRKFMAQYPDGIRPGDVEGRNSELARRMAELNVLYMLQDLQSAEIPLSVREWFGVATFCDYEEPRDGKRVIGLARKVNRETAEEVKRLIPMVSNLRNRLKERGPLKLTERLQDAYQPRESRRYEQGWCFSVGGFTAFRAAGQSHWNLLEDPARGWNLLIPEDQELIRNEIRDIIGNRDAESALQELSEMLRQYPGLRAYSCDKRAGGVLKRMRLEPVKEANIAEPVYTHSGNTRMLRPIAVRNGYTIEENAELPAEWQSDSRVMPALHLLTELRRNAAAAPYVDENGIWWRKECYGGRTGKRPNGMGEEWVAEPGLETMIEYFKGVADLGAAFGTNGRLNVCGVSLGGIQPEELDMSRLKNVTVYRAADMPEHQVRLMPGSPNAANPYQRKPYVVHTSDGVPLFASRMTRNEGEIAQTFTPLNNFASDLTRLYDFDTNAGRRSRQMDHFVHELLDHRTIDEERWLVTDESRINNEELFMLMFQDRRLPYFLEGRDPARLTRGEALAAELCRLMLLAEYGVNREEHIGELVRFCRQLRTDAVDKQLLKTTLHRVVSPDPNRYRPEELSRPENNHTPDQSPEDAEEH